jgi:glutaredoxin-like protein NrdH
MSETAVEAPKSVTVYTKPGCPSCVDTKELMTELAIVFNEVDISKDPVALKRLKDRGYRGAPVVETEDTSWFGFNEGEIRNLVTSKGLSPADDSMWDF